MKNPSLRPAIFLLLALGLSAPTLWNVLLGQCSAMSAGVHLVAAIAVARFSVLGVGRLIDNYRANVLSRAQASGDHGGGQ